jgi:hypothetical protein
VQTIHFISYPITVNGAKSEMTSAIQTDPPTAILVNLFVSIGLRAGLAEEAGELQVNNGVGPIAVFRSV